MSLDGLIVEFQGTDNYDDYAVALRRLLGDVHSNEDIDKVRTVVDDHKKNLMNLNKDFKDQIEANKRQAKINSDMERALYKANQGDESKIITTRGLKLQEKANSLRNNAELMKSEAKLKAMARGLNFDKSVDDWVSEHRIKTVSSNEGLICPICKSPDRGNTLNGEAACVKCMHKLVPQSELKDYNRAYRRKWIKRRRK